MYTSANAVENRNMQAAAIALMNGWTMDDLYDSDKIKSVISALVPQYPDILPYRVRNSVYRSAMTMRGAIRGGRR